jgi:hypothetical protein
MTNLPAVPTQQHRKSRAAQTPPAIALQQFIAEGERELAGLEESERAKHAEWLQKELLRRFPLKTKEDEDEYYQDAQDREEATATHADYEEGDGEGKDHFRSHLKVKCMDAVKQPPLRCTLIATPAHKVEVVLKPLPVNQFPETIVRGPDKAIMLEDGLAFSEYKPTGPYHHRVAKWMEQHTHVPKEVLECQYCGKNFEAKKCDQKFCAKSCQQKHYRGTKKPVEVEQHDPFDCECKTCGKVYDIFAEMRMELLTDEFGDKPFTRDLTEAEKAYILDFAKHMVEEANEQQ